MLSLEQKHGRPIEAVVAEAITAHGSVDRAADALAVNRKTLHGWVARLRIETRKVASVAAS